MRRRGFTLIEVVLVLTLLVALGAIVLPAVGTLLGPTLFEETVERVRAELLLARADAQRDGVVVRVTAEPVGRAESREDLSWRVVSRRVDLFARPPEGGDGSILGAGEDAPLGGDEELAAGALLLALPRGVRFAEPGDEPGSQIEDGRPEASERATEPPAMEQEEEESAAALDAEPRPIVLAIFMPDGSALASTETLLVGSDGRRATLSVSRWSGRVSVGAIRTLAAPSPDDAARGEAAEEGAETPPGPGAEGERDWTTGRDWERREWEGRDWEEREWGRQDWEERDWGRGEPEDEDAPGDEEQDPDDEEPQGRAGRRR